MQFFEVFGIAVLLMIALAVAFILFTASIDAYSDGNTSKAILSGIGSFVIFASVVALAIVLSDKADDEDKRNSHPQLTCHKEELNGAPAIICIESGRKDYEDNLPPPMIVPPMITPSIR